MTQKLGLVQYVKWRFNHFLKRLSSPFSDIKNTTTTKSRNTWNSTRNYSINKGVYMKNGKVLKPGTPEYNEFKKEMDDWSRNFSKEMKDFGVSMEEMGENMRNMFKKK